MSPLKPTNTQKNLKIIYSCVKFMHFKIRPQGSNPPKKVPFMGLFCCWWALLKFSRLFLSLKLGASESVMSKFLKNCYQFQWKIQYWCQLGLPMSPINPHWKTRAPKEKYCKTFMAVFTLQWSPCMSILFLASPENNKENQWIKMVFIRHSFAKWLKKMLVSL